MNHEARWQSVKVAKAFTSIRGSHIMIFFWIAFGIGASTASAEQPLDGIGLLGQMPITILWLGYPIMVYYCFSPRPAKNVGTLSLIAGITVAGLLILLESTSQTDSKLIAVAVFLLVLAPFIAAGRALQFGELQAVGRVRTNLLLGTISFFVLPFLGGFIHSRVRDAIENFANAAVE